MGCSDQDFTGDTVLLMKTLSVKMTLHLMPKR